MDKAFEIGNRILREPGFKPDKEYTIESILVTPENAAQMYEKFTAWGGQFWPRAGFSAGSAAPSAAGLAESESAG